nr:DUF3880 domain-containing protein [Butyrivibrio sp.]
MRILFYDWDEFNGEDCRDAMKRLGHEVDTFRLNMKGYDLTPEMDEVIRQKVMKTCDDASNDNGGSDGQGKRYYDLLFSFDYFPNISEACQKYGMSYVSWVFDCPHYTLDSHTINNEVNRVFVFDRKLFMNMVK